MNKLKIPENHSGISKTLRLPEDIVDNIQNLANIKNLSFNRIVISLLEFSLDNLDENDKIEKFKKTIIDRLIKVYLLLLIFLHVNIKIIIWNSNSLCLLVYKFLYSLY